MTDSTGRFSIINIPKGTYYARVSVIGYRSRKRNAISIGNEPSVIDLDTIRLSAKSLSTKEVQVTAEKENVVFDEDKIIMNVNRSIGNNAAEVLENTPMVSIDINGKISLLGRAGVVIYIDGIPAKYSGFENSDDLKMLSSSEIEKIEIVLDPTLEYSERGDGGIINIITKKRPSTKYSGHVGLGGDTKNRFISIFGISYAYKNYNTWNQFK